MPWDDPEHKILPGVIALQTKARESGGAEPLIVCRRCLMELMDSVPDAIAWTLDLESV